MKQIRDEEIVKLAARKGKTFTMLRKIVIKGRDQNVHKWETMDV